MISDHKERDWEFYIIIKKISRFNPSKAVQLVDLISEPYYRDNILAYSLIIMGSKDPEGALRFVDEKIDQYSDRVHAKGAIIQGF